jgi:hypothetical protein
MKLSDLEDYDKLEQRFEKLDIRIDRLENKMDARFNQLERRFGLIWVAIVSSIAQILVTFLNK